MARAILAALNYVPTVLILSQDSFYREHTPEELEAAFKNEYDFGASTPSCLPEAYRRRLKRTDHPDAIDMTLFAKVRDAVDQFLPR